ncbi:DUF2125 domain-containing protein [Azospirillum griseum]|uniref:DUF2125 domain-containing protein n=1 Tax=Azospirillum griseum TaxID=2496639 RepID=A0A431VLK7_9PROT|nr:DUF2125 domain-containing protein [Azospirillum griseum]RTR23493.1 DUF2125 domain-containing protein [Azospirillum griseum]
MPPMRFPKLRNRLIAGLALLVALPPVGYGLWWWQAARAVERGVLTWIEQQRANGGLANHAGLSVEGFPFALRAALEQPHLATRGAEWRGTRLVAEATPWNPTEVNLSLPGEQRLTLVQAGQPPLDVTAHGGGGGRAVWALNGTLETLRLTFTDLTAQALNQPLPIASLDLSAAQPSQPPGAATDTALTIGVTANGLTLPDNAPPSLGRDVKRAEFSARVMGRLPQPEPVSLSSWSREGGTVQVDRLALDWGPLAIALNGTLSLDPELQPLADLTAEIHGAPAALNAAKPMMRPNEAAMARTVVAMLSRPTGPGGAPVITTPVKVQDHALFLGPLKVASVPRVVW